MSIIPPSASTATGKMEIPVVPREIKDEEMSFLANYLQEKDLNSLRLHVLEVWKQSATSSHLYRCIADFMFLKTRVAQHFYYPTTLKRLTEAKQRGTQCIWLEMGVAFGTDVRKIIMDGWPRNWIYAIDVVHDYWNYGLKLYKETQETVGIHFMCGNVISSSFLSELDNVTNQPADFLLNKVDILSLAAVLHVLAKEDSRELLRKCLTLLKPGGTLFGGCVGSFEDQGKEWYPTPDQSGRKRFLYSRSSLESLFKELGYENVQVVQLSRMRNMPSSVNQDAAEAESIIYLDFVASRRGE